MTSLHPLLLEEEIDLYALLGVDTKVETKAIQRAYRKTALLYHPDKNSSKEAAVKFHQLSVAVETLTDDSLRQKYDQLLNSRYDKIRRTEQLSAERRKFQDDLLRREQEYASSKRKQRDNVSTAAALEEMREHNRGLVSNLETKRRKLYTDALDSARTKREHSEPKTRKEQKVDVKSTADSATLKIKWSKRGAGRDIGVSDITSLFSRYGPIEHVAVLPNDQGKKARTALIEFSKKSSVVAAKSILEPETDEINHVLYDLLRKVG